MMLKMIYRAKNAIKSVQKLIDITTILGRKYNFKIRYK